MMEYKTAEAPIGVFDSGLGGLTALRQLQRELPAEDYIYFGDTARVPYGCRDKETLAGYAAGDIALLRSFGVKAILVACGTISSVLLEEIKGQYDIPLVGVVESAAQAAARATENGKIGIWGTAASIRSGSYARRLKELGYGESVAIACPRLVPLIEAGKTSPEDPEARAAVQEYLEPVLAGGADTLILGCTHYPLLESVIRAEAGAALKLIDSGRESGATLKQALARQALLRRGERGKTRYLVSGRTADFERLGGRFMNCDLSGKVEQADAKCYG